MKRRQKLGWEKKEEDEEGMKLTNWSLDFDSVDDSVGDDSFFYSRSINDVNWIRGKGIQVSSLLKFNYSHYVNYRDSLDNHNNTTTTVVKRLDMNP